MYLTHVIDEDELAGAIVSASYREHGTGYDDIIKLFEAVDDELADSEFTRRVYEAFRDRHTKDEAENESVRV